MVQDVGLRVNEYAANEPPGALLHPIIQNELLTITPVVLHTAAAAAAAAPGPASTFGTPLPSCNHACDKCANLATASALLATITPIVLALGCSLTRSLRFPTQRALTSMRAMAVYLWSWTEQHQKYLHQLLASCGKQTAVTIQGLSHQFPSQRCKHSKLHNQQSAELMNW